MREKREIFKGTNETKRKRGGKGIMAKRGNAGKSRYENWESEERYVDEGTDMRKENEINEGNTKENRGWERDMIVKCAFHDNQKGNSEKLQGRQENIRKTKRRKREIKNEIG